MRFTIVWSPAVRSPRDLFRPQSPLRFGVSVLGLLTMSALGGGAIAAGLIATPILAGALAAGAAVAGTLALLIFCLGKPTAERRGFTLIRELEGDCAESGASNANSRNQQSDPLGAGEAHGRDVVAINTGARVEKLKQCLTAWEGFEQPLSDRRENLLLNPADNKVKLKYDLCRLIAMLNFLAGGDPKDPLFIPTVLKGLREELQEVQDDLLQNRIDQDLLDTYNAAIENVHKILNTQIRILIDTLFPDVVKKAGMDLNQLLEQWKREEEESEGDRLTKLQTVFPSTSHGNDDVIKTRVGVRKLFFNATRHFFDVSAALRLSPIVLIRGEPQSFHSLLVHLEKVRVAENQANGEVKEGMKLVYDWMLQQLNQFANFQSTKAIIYQRELGRPPIGER